MADDAREVSREPRLSWRGQVVRFLAAMAGTACLSAALGGSWRGFLAMFGVVIIVVGYHLANEEDRITEELKEADRG